MIDKTVSITSSADVTSFQTDGVTVLKGVFSEWIPTLQRGVDRNIAEPSKRALIHTNKGVGGRFLEDFCNWERIPEYRRFIETSALGRIAAELMQSKTVQFFHDHLLYKEANSSVATPWHQDMPYYCVDGNQTASFWVPMNPRAMEVSLRCVAGSHHWPKLIRPTSWSSNENFYADSSEFMDIPNIDAGGFSIKTWALEPGDAIVFNFKTVHGANANTSPSLNQTLSFRLLGDDARFFLRPGRTSPDYPGINQKNGQRLRQDWFPMLESRADF